MTGTRIARLAVSASFALAAFATGAFASARFAWFQPVATLTIENRSGQRLRSLEVRHESSGATGTFRLPALADGASIDVRVPVRGEGGYTVRAVLSDGTTPRPSEGYVERGYRVTEVVGASRIGPSETSTSWLAGAG